MEAATVPPGDQGPVAEMTMDIDMDLDLGPEPEPEPEPIQTVSILTEHPSADDRLHKTDAKSFSLFRIRPYKKVLLTR